MSDHDAASEHVEGVEPEVADENRYPVMVYIPLTARRAARAGVADTVSSAGGKPEELPMEGIRLTVPIAVLLAILIFAGGFWVGATVEKDHSNAVGRSLPLARSGAEAQP